MRSGGSGGGLPHAGEVRLGLPRPTGCAAREQASARALYVRMMCDRRLWPVWAIDAVRRAASAARSPAAGRLCIRLYWVCGCIKFFTISYRADLSRPLHDDTRSQKIVAGPATVACRVRVSSRDVDAIEHRSRSWRGSYSESSATVTGHAAHTCAEMRRPTRAQGLRGQRTKCAGRGERLHARDVEIDTRDIPGHDA